jgi:hypothetical protein
MTMGFYYISLFSIFPLGIAYGALALLFWGIERLTRSMPGRKAFLVAVGAVFVVLPVAEELWIAWNFGQACKEAGTFIYKKVQVDGFYDSTMRSAYENTKQGRYKFVEEATADHMGIERVERADDEAKTQALTWYAKNNPGKERPKDTSIFYSVNEKEQIAVLPNGIDAWRVTKLDHPTARYHFRYTDPMNGTPWAHKIIRSGSTVIDSDSNQEIARYTSFGRRPPWFFIGLDNPAFACDAPGRWPLTRKSMLVYREALIPADANKE